MIPIEKQLGKDFVNNDGGNFGCICAWRKETPKDYIRHCTVGEWLSKKENQNGTWLIDTGGIMLRPSIVKWNKRLMIWEYCNHEGLTINELKAE